MKINPRWLILIVSVLFLAGCGSDTPSAAATPIAPEETPRPTQLPATQVEGQPTAAPTATDEASSEGLGEIPQGDPQLKASDPAAVQLAAGEPTLVEFFAFW